MATFGADQEPLDYFEQNATSLLIPIDDLNIESLLDFIPSAVNEKYTSIPGNALMEVADRLKAEGEVNILMVQLSNKAPTDILDPDLSDYSDVHVSGVLYLSAVYNQWLEKVAADTGGEIL